MCRNYTDQLLTYEISKWQLYSVYVVTAGLPMSKSVPINQQAMCIYLRRLRFTASILDTTAGITQTVVSLGSRRMNTVLGSNKIREGH